MKEPKLELADERWVAALKTLKSNRASSQLPALDGVIWIVQRLEKHGYKEHLFLSTSHNSLVVSPHDRWDFNCSRIVVTPKHSGSIDVILRDWVERDEYDETVLVTDADRQSAFDSIVRNVDRLRKSLERKREDRKDLDRSAV